LLAVRDLVVEYPAPRGRKNAFRALHSVSIDVKPGETVGLVGESGSGKTTLGRAILGLAPVTSGEIQFDGRDISHASTRERRALAKDVQVVFQDPYTSLNPAMTIGQILGEPLRAGGVGRRDAESRIGELLERVRLPADAAARYAREFSGGQRQRVAIARALALQPRLIVCDEPVSALDLSTQATVLDLLIELQDSLGVAYLFVSHDLSVVRYVSHRVAVMYRGEIVEMGDGIQVTTRPEQAYTRKLMLAAPVPDPRQQAINRAARAALVS
jgi:peptide/nickel transport system ATP-binding protein